MSVSVGLAAGSAPSAAGPYMLRNLIEGVPLSTEDVGEDVQINCVEFLDTNLYVGTTAAELLHFVQIPPDTNDPIGNPSYMLASRLQCPGGSLVDPSRPGIQQILLLPNVAKATVLCNGTVTFYSLPELSPVFGTTQVQNCKWVGGLDLNEPQAREDAQNGTVTVLLSLRKMIRVIKIGSSARAMKMIDFAGSTISIRRDAFACVADNRSYALLDVERQLKIPLFPISSLDDSPSSNIGGQAESLSGSPTKGHQRNISTPNRGHSPMNSEDLGHGKRSSRSSVTSDLSSAQARAADLESVIAGAAQPPRDPSPTPDTSASPARGSSPNKLALLPEKPLPVPPDVAQPASSWPTSISAQPSSLYLKPHVISPSPQEFLLVTGTGTKDPGVGIFVNLEGDVTRSTLEFEKYPDAVVSDGRGIGIEINQNNHDESEEGYVLASTSRESDAGTRVGLEIQRWDLDPSDALHQKSWLDLSPSPNVNDTARLVFPGVKSVTDYGDMHVEEMMSKLQLIRFVPPRQARELSAKLADQISDQTAPSAMEHASGAGDLNESQKVVDAVNQSEDVEDSRNAEESQFARRLCRAKSRVVVWLGNTIWWVVRTPLVLQLEAVLLNHDANPGKSTKELARNRCVEVINSIRGHEAKSETEYVSLGYIRQKAGLLLIINAFLTTSEPALAGVPTAEYALLEGSLDPRLVMSLFPILQNEVVEGEGGIWIHGGVQLMVNGYLENTTAGGSFNARSLPFLKTYLAACRSKKGFGSVTGEKEVSHSIDAGLLIVLLELDKESPRGPARPDSVRAELNDLMDHGLDCFDRAITILESYHRLYALSRLYQSRKLAGEVLATWQRIIEGERDDGGEFTDGESTIRNYLLLIRNEALVKRYGVWLAARNTKLGIQVFSDEKSRVKLEPTRVIEVLRQGAPDAVKHYLEHLVFTKNDTKYVNELITYYLDIVINKLETSDEARDILGRTYESYRALHPPKPTYRQFIIDNAMNEEWWRSRLRLLQLLGGSHGAASQYDVSAILQRIEPFTEELVPEVIILGGRQSRHQEALRLLTHSLGDYDTAISYCLRGGSSIYHPVSGGGNRSLPSHEEQARLFGYLLPEFLRIADISDRVEQTSGLLERFGAWFDVGHVLGLVPDTWAVEIVSGFLVSALRRIVTERSETMVARALSGSENLRINTSLIRHIESAGPSIEAQTES